MADPSAAPEALVAENAALRAEIHALREELLDAEDQLVRLERQHDVLENFVFGLEREHEEARAKLLETQKELTASYEKLRALAAEQTDILAHIDQALFAVDASLNIQPGYSAMTERIFGRADLAGLPLGDLFDADVRDKVTEHVALMFAAPHAAKPMLDRRNPIAEHRRAGAPGEPSRSLTFQFGRVFDRSAPQKRVAKVLVVVADRTDAHRLREELDRRMREQAAELERATTLLRAPASIFDAFVVEARETLRAASDAVRSPAKATDAALRDLLRSFHALKGTASAMELHRLAGEAHRAEDAVIALARSSAGALGDAARSALIEAVDHMRDEIESGASLIERFGDLRARVAARRDGWSELVALCENAVTTESAGRAVLVTLRAESALDEPERSAAARSLRHPILALVRNAVAHGAEPPDARRIAGKPEAMTIELAAISEGEDIVVRCRDDGRGIDAAALASAAGVAGEGDLSLVFMPRLSTARQVDALAGRGVGMDIVRRGVEVHGGRVDVRSKRGAHTTFELRLPSDRVVDAPPSSTWFASGARGEANEDLGRR